MRLIPGILGSLLGVLIFAPLAQMPLGKTFMLYIVTWLFVVVGMFLGGCTGLLQDPPANMEHNLTPDSVANAPVQGTTAAPPPLDVSKARRVGWKPRHATPAGDVVEGHAIEITPTSLTQEVVAPAMIIPRAPRFVTPSATGTSSGTGRGRSSHESSTPPIPAPVPATPIHPLLQGQGGPYVPSTP